jgi:hypothetical protein
MARPQEGTKAAMAKSSAKSWREGGRVSHEFKAVQELQNPIP